MKNTFKFFLVTLFLLITTSVAFAEFENVSLYGGSGVEPNARWMHQNAEEYVAELALVGRHLGQNVQNQYTKYEPTDDFLMKAVKLEGYMVVELTESYRGMYGKVQRMLDKQRYIYKRTGRPEDQVDEENWQNCLDSAKAVFGEDVKPGKYKVFYACEIQKSVASEGQWVFTDFGITKTEKL